MVPSGSGFCRRRRRWWWRKRVCGGFGLGWFWCSVGSHKRNSWIGLDCAENGYDENEVAKNGYWDTVLSGNTKQGWLVAKIAHSFFIFLFFFYR